MTDDRIAEFHAAVNDRFDFLLQHGFIKMGQQSFGERYGSVEFRSSTVDIKIGWDAHDGGIDADMNGESIWHLLQKAGAWNLPGYAGYSIESMRHGLDRLADFLRSYLRG